MKRQVCVLAGLFSALWAVTAQAGVIGQVYHTDISTFVDGAPVSSYNVNQEMAVVAEDLRAYGYDVVWDGVNRTLSITQTEEPLSAVKHQTENAQGEVGTAWANVYDTDISTFVEGKEVPGYNIDGQTLVRWKDLAAATGAQYQWLPEQREARLVRKGFAEQTYLWSQTVYNEMAHQENAIAGGFTVELTKSEEDGLFHVTGGSGAFGGIDYFYVECDRVGFSRYQRIYQWDGEELPALEKLIEEQAGPTAVSQWMRVTVNGVPYDGTLQKGQGNGHRDYFLCFDRLVPLEEVEQICLEVGQKE